MISTMKATQEILIKASKDLNYHDQKTLHKYLLNQDVDVVINCSGFTGTPNIDEAETKKELCWFLNVQSPLQVNQTCNQLNRNYIHVSSGCVFDGYDKEWSEEDVPNYGLFSDKSSFYSKSKHAFENLSTELRGKVLRIRMPFGPDKSPRNYLSKIRKYENLIQYKNSKTYIPDLCAFVQKLITREPIPWNKREIYNVVNPGPLWTQEVIDILRTYGMHNPEWKFVNIAALDITAGRSNCVLDSQKVNQIHSFKTEREALTEILKGWAV